MNIKKYIAAGSLLALMALAGASCGSEEIMENGGGTEVPAGHSELVFNFGGLRLADAPQTRAEGIATADETVVESLVIVLAGVDDDTHTTAGAGIVYEYRSAWTTAPAETDHYKKLTLTQTGNVLTGKLTVDEAVMLPAYMAKKALVLVNGVQLRVTDATGAATTYINAEALSKLTYQEIYQLCGGSILSKDLAAQGKVMDYIWGPADLTAANIQCPLPMTARIDNINFHGATNVNVPLTRQVSRFDLRNGQTAQLRIGSIRPLKAAANIGFDPARHTRVDMMDQSFLHPTPDADWANTPAEVVPAFYTFPSPLERANQVMTFRVTAKKLNGTSLLWEDKTYTLNLEEAGKKPISIDPNTRYVINITEVTDLNITGVIEVAEWQQGGDIDGDLNPATISRKKPMLQDVADIPANKITWTLNNAQEPTALNFGAAYKGQNITFCTPPVKPIDAADPGADQPRVTIDVFREDGETSGVWLTVSSSEITPPITRAQVGGKMHTLTVGAAVDGKYPPLMVKVKNHFFPDQYILFRVTAQSSGNINIDTDTDNPIDLPDGWTQDPDADVFEEGTVEAPPLYNGQSPVKLAFPGLKAYYVAPENAATGVMWTEIDFSTICPTGWRVPTQSEVENMMPSTPTPNEVALILSAFPVGTYWGSDQVDDSNADIFRLSSDGSVGIGSYEKKQKLNVRCIRDI